MEISPNSLNNDAMSIIKQLRYSALIWYILCQFTDLKSKDFGENVQP